MAASSSSSSITNDGYEYDVFLSFRGPDTRLDFTGNLWNALHNRGIRTFRDDLEINKGNNIEKSLFEAIEKSKAAIVVLSPSYATSSFCLDELCHILKCMKEGRGRFVWPIFYDVDPSTVRWLKETYGEALDDHGSRNCHSENKLQEWEKALNELANLSGTVFKWKRGHEYEYMFIDKIVQAVSTVIRPFSLSIPNYLVGLETQKQDVLSLLNVGSDDKVYMVGIHGIGGIGKTTLAQVVYNSIVDQFDGSCYLEDVRRNTDKHGLMHLQNSILSKIFGENKIVVTSHNDGIKELEVRLKQKKVLLLLDNVDKLDQLQAIARPEWFGRGSRVIITTRDRQVVKSHGVESTYEVKELNKKDAYDFLRWKTLKTNEVSSCHEDVFDRAVTYVSGLPLAIEIMGSYLFTKKEEEWSSVLARYERIPKEEIFENLKVSFDALAQEEKDVFLDIACFFKGANLDEVKKILHDHYGYEIEDHVNVLIEKSLIKINEFNCLTLHDQIEDMGKEIVRLESPHHTGERSRLWSVKDVVEVLEENTNFKNIRRVSLIGCRSLRSILDMSSLQNLEDFSCSYCPDLITLDDSIGLLGKLKFFTVIYCEKLTTIPSLKLPLLEELTLHGLSSIESLSPTLDESLDKLKILIVKSCKKLTTIPSLKLPLLEELILHRLSSIESLSPTLDESLDKLKFLMVRRCEKLTTIPSLKLPLLEELIPEGLSSIESLSPTLDESLDKLKILRVFFCTNIKTIPPLKLASLEELNLSLLLSIESLSPMLDKSLDKLKVLIIIECRELWSFPPLMLPSLEYLSLYNCKCLKSFPPVMLPSLEILDLSYCECLESFPSITSWSMAKLKILRLKGCKKLRNIPASNWDSLDEFDHFGCESLEFPTYD